MNNRIKLIRYIGIILCVITVCVGICLLILSKTSSSTSSCNHITSSNSVRDNTPTILIPKATGQAVLQAEQLTVDISNTKDGYLIVNYTGDNPKVKFQIKTPDQIEYTYLITQTNQNIIYPLAGKNGTYTLTLLESVSIKEDLYAISFTDKIQVAIENEFSPYLYPNHYVNFSKSTKAIQKGVSLAEGCNCDLDVINHIYHYVIETITYDTQKAKDVTYGYAPDVDQTLSTKKGICFDYAALMAAMLRTQNIPTKLEVGYVGELYHAWISCYVSEIGWVDNIIEFDGKNWSLMDPTLGANNNRSSVKQYIGDGSKYVVKYTY